MDESSFIDADGITVATRRWLPPGDARAGVVIVHGASEHSARYDRVAQALNRSGYAVFALDLRGHGGTTPSTGRGRIGPRGMEGVLDDVQQVVAMARAELGDRPIVLFGHSMGSLVAQAFIERDADQLAGCVLSGSIGAIESVDELADGIRQAVDAGMADEPLDILEGANATFEPARTPFDWLSRDTDEVDLYVADPMCGSDHPLTYGYVAELLETSSKAMTADAIDRIPRGLPVLMLTGEEDPVSNGAVQVRELEARLRAAGLDVTAHYYAGARHEVLNEINRDEVHSDLLAWLDRVTAS
jgi:alpha-beta hydrolase superfamily lysophospholipase